MCPFEKIAFVLPVWNWTFVYAHRNNENHKRSTVFDVPLIKKNPI